MRTEWRLGVTVGNGFQVRRSPALSRSTLDVQVKFRGQWNT